MWEDFAQPSIFRSTTPPKMAYLSVEAASGDAGMHPAKN